MRSRGVTRSSGSRGFFSAEAAAFAAAAFSLACCAFSALASASGDLSALACLSGLPPWSCLSAIDLDSGTLGDAHSAPVIALADELETDARGFAVLRIGHRQIGQVNGRFLGNDAALLLRRLLLVALDHIDAAHQRAARVRTHLDHLPGPAPVAAGQHDNLVAL